MGKDANKVLTLSDEFKTFTADMYEEYHKLDNVKEEMTPSSWARNSRMLNRIMYRGYKLIRSGRKKTINRCFEVLELDGELDESEFDEAEESSDEQKTPEQEHVAAVSAQQPAATQQTPAADAGQQPAAQAQAAALPKGNPETAAQAAASQQEAPKDTATEQITQPDAVVQAQPAMSGQTTLFSPQ